MSLTIFTTDLTNTKSFWENYKPYFSNKHSKADTDIILSENDDLIKKKKSKIANSFNDYFGSIVKYEFISLGR